LTLNTLKKKKTGIILRELPSYITPK
jgi:hypothetical protein